MKSPFYTANADTWLRYSLCVESSNMITYVHSSHTHPSGKCATDVAMCGVIKYETLNLILKK